MAKTIPPHVQWVAEAKRRVAAAAGVKLSDAAIMAPGFGDPRKLSTRVVTKLLGLPAAKKTSVERFFWRGYGSESVVDVLVRKYKMVRPTMSIIGEDEVELVELFRLLAAHNPKAAYDYMHGLRTTVEMASK